MLSAGRFRRLSATATIALALASKAYAQAEPLIESSAGLVVVTFRMSEGIVRAYLPDDVAAGETFSGTLEGPAGFVLSLDGQAANAGSLFRWTISAGPTPQLLTLILSDAAGAERARTSFNTPRPGEPERVFRIPKLIEAGKPFPVLGPFDGDVATTRVMIGGAPAPPLAESRRRAIVRAPAHVLGAAASQVTEGSAESRGALHSLAIELGDPVSRATPVMRMLTIRGLAGVDRDVPLDVGGNSVFLSRDTIPPDGAFSTERAFGERAGITASLVIPRSRRDEVAILLRTPQRDAAIDLAQQHGDALRSLDFDALPVAAGLLGDTSIGDHAASAMLAADARRALSLILASMPQSDLNAQLIGFSWFLAHHAASPDPVKAEAREAALRVLGRNVSSAAVELAIHVVGLTGGEGDFPVLESFLRNGGLGMDRVHDASEAALARLGSGQHLENIRAELAKPLPPGATYQQGVRLIQVLRKAGVAGRMELVPVVCGHIADPRVIEIDIWVDPDRVALNSLSTIVDGPGAAGTTARQRSRDEWMAYCNMVVAGAK